MSDLDYIDGKKAQMDLAIAKWMEILSINWNASSVGCQVALDLQGGSRGEAGEQTLRSVFGVKSPTTILKRAASLRQYIVWFQ